MITRSRRSGILKLRQLVFGREHAHQPPAAVVGIPGNVAVRIVPLRQQVLRVVDQLRRTTLRGHDARQVARRINREARLPAGTVRHVKAPGRIGEGRGAAERINDLRHRAAVLPLDLPTYRIGVAVSRSPQLHQRAITVGPVRNRLAVQAGPAKPVLAHRLRKTVVIKNQRRIAHVAGRRTQRNHQVPVRKIELPRPRHKPAVAAAIGRPKVEPAQERQHRLLRTVQRVDHSTQGVTRRRKRSRLVRPRRGLPGVAPALQVNLAQRRLASPAFRFRNLQGLAKKRQGVGRTPDVSRTAQLRGNAAARTRQRTARRSTA